MLKIHENLEVPVWRKIQRTNFISIEKLADFLELSQEQRAKLLNNKKFPLNLPLRLAQKISKGTLEDPILKQFVPLEDEALIEEGFVQDPVGDQNCRKQSQLLHKYEGRVLLICTSACAMHCRYCFRQHFDYAAGDKLFEKELAQIAEDTTLTEVILSGGDPLSLSDQALEYLLAQLANIAHIERIRFHTRFPIGIPERITPAFLNLLENHPQQIWFVVHINHFQELDHAVLAALKQVHKTGAVMLNQAVLLKGVNDELDILEMLFQTLVKHGILPYYLHQLDKVQGAAHFEVEVEKGKKIIEKLTHKLSGYAIPKYVAEYPGEKSKTSL
jgi:EF-P beta-lysylation protein EpmB